MLASFPRAILHIDGDAFFASVEQALDPNLRGRPVVTGRERGIIAAASYEAKALGIQRGITLADARRICPQVVMLPSDYESYSLYSKRMFNIMRQYTPTVEEYSIDEGFADITGMRRVFRCNYPDLARKIQDRIERDLGITVSVGLSLTKGLSKLCSKFRKPCGFTAVRGRHIHLLLQRTPLEKVWGLGPSSCELLGKHQLRTAYDYVMRPEPWIRNLLHKPGRELWQELRGHSVWPVTPDPKPSYASIMKGKTFTPANGDRDYVYARLVKNVETALMKARRHHLQARRLGIVLRHHDFHHDGLEVRLNRATGSALEAMPMIRVLYDRVFKPGSRYRSTMVVLGELENDQSEQFELFQDRLRIEAFRKITEAVDELNRRYGKRTVRAGTALYMDGDTVDHRQVKPERMKLRMPGETDQRRLAFPRMEIRI